MTYKEKYQVAGNLTNQRISIGRTLGQKKKNKKETYDNTVSVEKGRKYRMKKFRNTIFSRNQYHQDHIFMKNRPRAMKIDKGSGIRRESSFVELERRLVHEFY